MRSYKSAGVLVGLSLLGGCCVPMQLLHKNLPGHGGGHATAGAGDPNAPQEYVMQEQPPAAPGQPANPAPNNIPPAPTPPLLQGEGRGEDGFKVPK